MAEFVHLEMLPADYGDALHLAYGDSGEEHHLWIDGGLTQSYRKGWKKRLQALARQGLALDLLVVTHIDTDHINGVRAFIEDNRRGRRFPAIIPVEEVWFNQYRHIRAYGEERAVAAEGELPVLAAASPIRWPTHKALLDELSRRAPRFRRLAQRVARQARREAIAPVGAAEGELLAGLLEGNYRSNVRFGDQAVVRTDIPPEVALPGGARMWILSPTPETLRKLNRMWTQYLQDNGLSLLLEAAAWGPPGSGDALVPALAQEAMLAARETFEPTPAARKEDAVLPLAELAQRPFVEDKAPANGSSVALLFEFAGRKVLLAGDAHPSVVAEGLRRLGYSPEVPVELAAFKLAHHGSRANTGPELLSLVRCSNYLISTDGSRFNHPDKECLARILWANRDAGETVFYFNYKGTPGERALAQPDERSRYRYRVEHLIKGQVLAC